MEYLYVELFAPECDPSKFDLASRFAGISSLKNSQNAKISGSTGLNYSELEFIRDHEEM